MRSYRQLSNSKPDREHYESSTKPEAWGPLCHALTMFHAVVRERRKFGALGWNCTYDFNDSDLRVSMRQLHLMVESCGALPFKALRYLTGECNYGGRVTDDHDRRALVTLLGTFYCSAAVQADEHTGHNPCGSPLTAAFSIVRRADLAGYLEHVTGLPDEESPLLVGLHPCASLSQSLLEADQLLEQVLCLSAQTAAHSVAAPTASAALSGQLKMIKGIRERTRGVFDLEAARARFPFSYRNSMSVVLVQEIARYNGLLRVLHSSLEALSLALEGKVVTTSEAEATHASLLSNRVPQAWAERAYPSLKPLSSWLADLAARTAALDSWIEQGEKPQVLWISGLFFPQSFLTAAKQDYARRFSYPIDRVALQAEVGCQKGSD